MKVLLLTIFYSLAILCFSKQTKVLSTATDTLYLNCSNFVDISTLDKKENSEYSTLGAKIIRTSNKKLINIIPNSPSVNLFIKDSNTIDTILFCAIPLPLPEVLLYKEDILINNKSIISYKEPNPIKIKVLAPSLIKGYERELRYKVTNWEASLIRQNQPIKKMVFTKPNSNLDHLIANAKPEDLIRIEILEVKRLNTLGYAEIVEVENSVFDFPIQ